MNAQFSDYLASFDWSNLTSRILATSSREIEIALAREGKGGIDDLIALLSPLASQHYLEDMAALSNRLTQQRFGKAIRLFAPMYLSNEC